MNDLVSVVEAQRDQFERVVSDKAIEFDREAGFALQILGANSYLAKVGMNNRTSLQNAVVNVAAIGISLNPASKLAYLVPRKNAICLDISYMGLMHIAQQCGAIQWGQARLVYEKDDFMMMGLHEQPVHKHNPFATDRGPLIGVYVVVKTQEGDYLTHAMTIGEVHAIRDRSEAWKAYKADNSKKCPWVTDEGEMVKKTCVKQAAKYWPRRERLDVAVHHLNTDGGEGVMIEANKMPEEEFEAFKKRIEGATTKDAAKAVWRESLAICQGLGDAESASKLKEALLAHAAFIDSTAAQEKAAA